MRRRSRLVKIPASGGGGGGGGGATYDTPTHYASPTGTEAWATATDVDHPCSAATALANAAGGNVVQFAAGSYTSSSGGGEWRAAYEPTNSGSAGNYITFQGNHAGTVVLGHTVAAPIIGVYGQDYIVFRGFRCDEANGISSTGTGPVTVSGTSHHIIIEDCEIDGNGNPNSVTGNHPGVRLEGCQDVIVRYNWIHDCNESELPYGGVNAAGVQCYESGRCEIYSNTIERCGSGVFLKNLTNLGLGYIDWFLIHHNWIENVGVGFDHGHTPFADGVFAKYYQNVIILQNSNNSASNETEYGWTDGLFYNLLISAGKNGLMVNNTVIGGLSNSAGHRGTNLNSSTSGNKVWNNIFVNADRFSVDGQTGQADTSKISLEHNCYYSSANFRIGTPTYTIAEWRTTFLQDDAAPDSHQSDPVFVDGPNKDYRLDTGSPCLDAGIDTLNLLGGGTTEPINQGAYITGDETIGRP